MGRETFGVETILDPRRRIDWHEPYTDEGSWQLNPSEAGDDE